MALSLPLRTLNVGNGSDAAGSLSTRTTEIWRCPGVRSWRNVVADFSWQPSDRCRRSSGDLPACLSAVPGPPIQTKSSPRSGGTPSVRFHSLGRGVSVAIALVVPIECAFWVQARAHASRVIRGSKFGCQERGSVMPRLPTVQIQTSLVKTIICLIAALTSIFLMLAISPMTQLKTSLGLVLSLIALALTAIFIIFPFRLILDEEGFQFVRPPTRASGKVLWKNTGEFSVARIRAGRSFNTYISYTYHDPDLDFLGVSQSLSRPKYIAMLGWPKSAPQLAADLNAYRAQALKLH